MDNDEGIPHAKMRALIERFDQWSLKHENYLRTSYSGDQLAMGLRQLLHTVDLDLQSFDLLMAISCAIEGRHHAFKLVIKSPPANGSFKGIKKHELWASSTRMADEIDIAVANGEKSESALEDAMTRYGLSRPEAFRRLKQVRAYRALSFKVHLQVEAERNPEGHNTMPLLGPEGYIVTEEGKFARMGR